MSEIKLYKNRYGKLAFLLIVSSAFLLAGIWALGQQYVDRYDNIMSYICLIFGIVALAFSTFQILDRRVQILITPNGIADRSTKMKMIPWEHIQEAYPIKISGQSFIALSLAEQAKNRPRLYRWAALINNAVGAQEVNINIGLINVGAQRLSDLINLLSRTEPDLRTYVIKHWKLDGE